MLADEHPNYSKHTNEWVWFIGTKWAWFIVTTLHRMVKLPLVKVLFQ